MFLRIAANSGSVHSFFANMHLMKNFKLDLPIIFVIFVFLQFSNLAEEHRRRIFLLNSISLETT